VMNHPGLRKLFLCTEIAMFAGAMFGLSGCALGTFQTSPVEPVVGAATAGAPMQGKLIGGQNPVSGASVYLFAAGNSAAAHTYGTGATSLLTSAVLPSNGGSGGKDANNNFYVTTDSSGGFSIPSGYACPGAVGGYPAEVYLLAVGGNSGAGANGAIALMAALGPCTSASALAAAVPIVEMNEITTVAAVWALQQFMSAPSGIAGSINIGAPSTNLVGLQNAFTMAANLANIANGTAVPANTVATPESDRIYSIGDILSYCVNSSGTSCSSLFTSVVPAGTALSTKGVAASALDAPADTIQAAWYLAQFPTNIAGLSCGASGGAFFCIQSTGAPFPALATAPTDWTLAVGYKPLSGTVDAIDDPYNVVLDNYGNAWVDSVSGDAGDSAVVPLAPTGVPIYAPVTSYTVGANSGYAANLVTADGITSAVSYTRTIFAPRGMTIDSTGNVWLADYNNEETTGETAISGGTFTCSTDCFFGTVAKFPAATGIGTASNSAIVGYYTPLWAFPAAADATGDVYFGFIGGSGGDVVGKLNSSGAFTTGVGIGEHPFEIAVDNNTSNSGPFVWIQEDGCAATSGGTANLIAQVGSGNIDALTQQSGLVGANTGCTSEVRDKIPASTGQISGIAFDASNNIWMINASTLPLGGTTVTGTTGALNTVTYGVVTDPSTGTGVQVSTTNANNSVMSSAGLGGMNDPQFGEVDGSGNLWISNHGAATISEVNVTGAGTASIAINSLSGAGGFQHSETASALGDSEGIGIDLSGNVWVANSAGTGIHYMTVLVGAATPVGPLLPGKYGVAP
jgi:hypothetical protein